MCEGIVCLSEFIFPLEEQSDSVVVPADPLLDVGGRVGDRGVDALYGKRDAIDGENGDGQVVGQSSGCRVESSDVEVSGLATACDEVGVLFVELAVVEFHFDGDGCVELFGQHEFVVNDLSGSGRDLVVVEWREDILRVASIDASAVDVEQEDIDEVRPRVDFTLSIEVSTGSDHPVSGGDGDFEPDLIRVDGALGEEVSEFDGPDDGIHQVAGAGFESGDIRS